MVLLLAVLAGLIVGLAKAWIRKQPFLLPDLSLTGLGLFAFLPQFLVFYLPTTSSHIPNQWASGFLVFSQLLFLIFFWFNFRQPGFWMLGVGVILNLVVICLNGGWMPISPEMVQRLFPNAPVGAWEIGLRLGNSKDVVLNLWNMRLGFLGDCIYIPFPPPLHPAAFSLGDFFIAIGAAGFLSTQGDTQVFHIKTLSFSALQHK